MLKIVSLNNGRSNPTRKLLRTVGRKPVTEILRNFKTVCLSEGLNNEFRHDLLDFKDFGLSIGVKVPVYGYTKVLAHNLNSKKTSGAAFG